jgi:pimeloyl-ACP methyl ester carboxylesterase
MMPTPFRIESLLAARLFLAPQVVGQRLYFISNLSGRLSLYAMPVGGGVPIPLLPPDIALPNPHHLAPALSYEVLPALGQILVLIDRDGDENYQPMLIPIEGGIPEPLFGDEFAGQQVICVKCDAERLVALFSVDPRTEPLNYTWLTNLATRERVALGSSAYGNYPMAVNPTYSEVILADSYTVGDIVLYRWRQGDPERTLLLGTPLDQRTDTAPMLNGITSCELTANGNLLFTTSLFDDCFGLGYCRSDDPSAIQPVTITGLVHTGVGELERLEQRTPERYTLQYNIDGSSWVYEGSFDEANLRFTADRVLCGTDMLSNGVLEHLHYERQSDRYALAFSTATTPVQLYLLEPDGTVVPQTQERVLGIPQALLAPGEDASYVSHDGLRISARLYLPAPDLGFAGRRPVIFYIHGGPQSQERPDFTWFSMPLIQFLTLNGFAVFVPNVRGSTGYGMDYVKRVDHDWGGQDRLDHVAAFDHLRQHPQLDVDRAGVMGRSYGGYMTLTLAGRHPDLWKAACDLFGPYNLFTFLARLPETWKTYFYLALGHPEQDREFLIERSPSTHLHNLACPLLVIQGANDPRVVEAESRDLVEALRSQGKTVEYLVFEDEGHDVIKYQNKVTCYNRIATFFAEHLQP